MILKIVLHFYFDPLTPGKMWRISISAFGNGYVKYIVDQLITTLHSVRENNIGASKMLNIFLCYLLLPKKLSLLICFIFYSYCRSNYRYCNLLQSQSWNSISCMSSNREKSNIALRYSAIHFYVKYCLRYRRTKINFLKLNSHEVS